ncbi:MAG: 2-oxoglutarate dehydrogenase, E2 component, dihydrolipoamide succinyltransferase [Actinomycetota bacterium]|nr:2-oxoglutarate dehydrogenase, E2 component, dihydrolipoamide succinyltransferase [Actinomycetota bacterium]
MSVSVTMPQLGESVTEGTVTRWLKQVGDTITADEPLLEISTDKVDTEIPAPASGVLLAISAAEDETVLVGAELGVIGAADEAGASPAAPAAPAPVAAPEPVAAVAEPIAAAPVPEAPIPSPATPSLAAPAASGATVNVLLPQLGESVTEGTVTRWLKQLGEAVTVDEPLVEISTDKVDTELPSPATGVLLSILVAEDATAEVGAVLGLIGSADSAVAPAAAPAAPAPAATVAPPAPAPVPTPVPAPVPVTAVPAPAAPVPVPVPVPAALPAAASSDGESYVTPLVRRLATQNGVDLSSVVGTGIGGRIRKQDVLAVAEANPATPATSSSAPSAVANTASPSPLRGHTEKISRLRRVIAERMVESLHVSAQLTTVLEVDVTAIAKLRSRVKDDFEAREGVKLTYLPFISKAAVEALKQFPMVNASIDMAEGTITYHDSENLGIAVDTDRGLLVPVIRNAGDLNIAGLSRSIADLAERTRQSKVLPDELSGGTFTITNTGSRGALFDTPIINQPQVAILGTGAIVKRPVVVPDNTGQEVIAIRSMMYLSLSYDHRLVDGADAARFLVAMKARLEEASFGGELGL